MICEASPIAILSRKEGTGTVNQVVYLFFKASVNSL